MQQSHPQAAGLVVAKDQAHARYIAELLERITGIEPVLAISDEPQSQQRISDFAWEDCRDRWIVAVKMISEGIDIPRLRVGVYATNILTELFFRQLAGRLIRLAPGLPWTAPVYLYLPGHPALLEYARDYAEQRRHVLSHRNEPRSRSVGERELFKPISASALALGTVPAVPEPMQGTPLEQLDWALLRLDALLREGMALKEGLLGLRVALGSAPAQDAPLPSVGQPQLENLSQAAKDVLIGVAYHRAISGLAPHHLEALCQLSAKQCSEALVDLRLEGMVENMALTDRGKQHLGAALPPVLENTADVIKLWLQQLPEYEGRLLRALFACDRKVTLDQWAKAAGFGSLSKGLAFAARQNLIELGLVSETKESYSKLFSIRRSLQDDPPAYTALK